MLDLPAHMVHDHGDEDDYKPPPVVPNPLGDLLRQWEDERKPGEPSHCMDYWPFQFMVHAEFMRACCEACALEANGEDGS